VRNTLTSSRSNVRWGHALAVAGLLVSTFLAFLPVLGNGFVNWDDPTVIVQNQQLGSPHVVRWAFTTTLVGHYQPLAWLAWSALKTSFGLSAEAFHGVSLVGHLVNAVLLYFVALRLTSLAGLDLRQRRIAAITASAVFAIHPVRVEAVAWASALPYILSLSALLLAFLAYLNYATMVQGLPPRDRSRAAGWLVLSICCYAASLLTRANAFAFPLLLLAVDVYPIGRRGRLQTALLEKLPFLLVAVGAAVMESRAREIATLQEVGVGARMTMAATAPFIYLGRTVVPTHLSPLDPLPIEAVLDWWPLLLGLGGLTAIAVAAWTLRSRWPALAVASIAYVATLAPVVGLTPSGLQATADRYMYLPGVIVSLLLGAAAARLRPARRLGIAVSLIGLAVLTALALLTRQQTLWWHDSITLWTRAADLDPRNDVATYNLAIALADAGREDEAISRYEQTLRLVPEHTLARQNLILIRASRAERDADRLAEAGRLSEASEQYAQALALDSQRLHARAARGIILMRSGRLAEAAAELRVAFDANVKDTEVPNALAFALMQTGRSGEAVRVLETAVARHPDDLNLAHNLARLLATAPDPQVRDGALALRMALDIRNRTGGADPRVLDTLAAAYAAVGRFDLARDTATQAASRARQLGDLETAEQISAHARSYRR
jgi:Flp pilus assembly protein TadD